MITVEQSLPKGWRWAKLTELLASLETGSRPKGGAQGITSGVPSLSAEHITNLGTFDFTNIRYVPREFYDQMSRGHIKQNDILIVKDGATTGKTIFIDEHFPLKEAVVNEHVFLCRPNQEIVTPLYLFYFLWSPVGQTQIRLNFQGAAIGGINQSFTENVLLPLPPIDEQKRIAVRLDEQMRHIEQARQAAEESLSAAWELPSKYLREVFENDVANTEAKIRLGDILKLRKEVVHPYNNPKGPAAFVGLEHIEANSGVRVGSVEVEMSKLTGRKPKFYKGDIVYGYLRPYLNKVWVAEFDGLCSVDQYVYSIDESKVDVDFIAWFMRSPVYLERAPIDTTPGQLPRIRTEEVASVLINLPPLEEQKRISLQISEQHNTVNKLMASLESQLAEINELPSALLRQAFAGELSA